MTKIQEKKIKILFIAMEYPPMIWWLWIYVKNLLSSLSDFPVEILLLAAGDRDEITRDGPIQIIRLLILKELYNRGWNILQWLDQIIDIIRDFWPQIIHSQHSLDSMLTQILMTRFPIVQVISSHRTPEHRDITLITKGKTCMFDFINNALSKYYITSSMIFNKAIIGSINGNSSRKIIKLIYPWIDRSFYKRASQDEIDGMRLELGINRNDKVILIPLRIRKRKWLYFAWKGLSALNIDGVSFKIILTWLPSDDQETNIFEEFKAFFTDKQLINHRKFEDVDMPILYSLADIVFLPSEAEWLGICLLEAMACQCPVIWIDTIGVNEVIDDWYNWYLIPYNDVGALHRAINDIFLRTDIKENFVSNWLKILEARFSLLNQWTQHYNFYKSIAINHNLIISSIIYTIIDNNIYFCINQNDDFVLKVGKVDHHKTFIENVLIDLALKWIFGLNKNPSLNLWIRVIHKNKKTYEEHRFVFEILRGEKLPTWYKRVSFDEIKEMNLNYVLKKDISYIVALFWGK